MAAAPVWSVDPRTGKQREQVAVEATAQEVDAAVRAAHAARGALADRTRTRAPSCAPPPTCSTRRPRTSSSRPPTPRPRSARSASPANSPAPRYQLRAFADIVDEGAFLDVVIDHADDTATPPIPDLRRYKVPLGVVAVYAAVQLPASPSPSPGGDTASALAAGCPVVVKAHPDHPATSELCRRRPAPGRRRARHPRGRRRPRPRLRGGRRAGQAPAGHRAPASPVRYAAAAPSSTRRPPGPCRSPSTASWAPSTPS